MPRRLTTAAILLVTLAACEVAAEDPTACYDNGRVDPARTAQWQAALAGQDAALMAQLAGNWTNEMTAEIGGVLSRALFAQRFQADGQQTTRSVNCPVSDAASCDERVTNGTWAASQNGDGTISLATRENDGNRAGFCIIKDIALRDGNQLVFADTGGLYLTRN